MILNHWRQEMNRLTIELVFRGAVANCCSSCIVLGQVIDEEGCMLNEY